MELRNSGFGIALVVVFTMLAPLSDGLAKLALETTPLLPLLLARYGVQAVLLGAILMIRDKPLEWPHTAHLALGLRGMLTLLAMLGMFVALRHLPLADTIAIAYVFPFLMLILARQFLHETVTRAQIFACVFGFIGVLMIAQPSFLNVGVYALLPLGVAGVFAVFQILTRMLSRAYDPIALGFWSGLPALVIVLMWAALWPEYFDLSNWPLLVVIGIIGALSNLVLTAASHMTASARLAPYFYLELPFSVLIGYWIFADIPNLYAALGIVIIILSGLATTFWAHSKGGHAPKRPDKNPSITSGK